MRGEKVYYLRSFPGDALVIVSNADPASFRAFDQTSARDGRRSASTAVLCRTRTRRPSSSSTAPTSQGRPSRLPTRSTGERRPGPFRTARQGTVQAQHRGVLERRRPLVRRSRTLRDHLQRGPLPVHQGHAEVHVNGNPIDGADPATFRVGGGAYAHGDQRVSYFTDQIADADMPSFRPFEGRMRLTRRGSTGWESRS